MRRLAYQAIPNPVIASLFDRRRIKSKLVSAMQLSFIEVNEPSNSPTLL